MSAASKLLIAIPMKDPKASKTRLSGTLNEADRSAFAFSLFAHTLEVIAHTQAPVSVVVITESGRIAEFCDAHGVEIIKEDQSAGLNRACDRAADWAIAKGYSRMVILPADLALLNCRHIEQLASLPVSTGQIAMCESSDGGTNCLLTSPPDALPFSFGKGSFRAHRKAAMSLGLSCEIIRDSEMRFDVDTSADLAALHHLRSAGMMQK